MQLQNGLISGRMFAEVAHCALVTVLAAAWSCHNLYVIPAASIAYKRDMYVTTPSRTKATEQLV